MMSIGGITTTSMLISCPYMATLHTETEAKSLHPVILCYK